MATIPTSPGKIGRYQILGELGRGAMGRVYRAFDPTIGRNVALKTIPLDTSDPELAMRFRREAQAAGILSHPNIVTIYDAGEDAGFLYIAMELVEGQTLQQMLAQGPLPLDQVISIGEQTGAALDHAHARAIIHRDIKPANIMMQAGMVKVTDFGVAKAGAAGMTSTGQVLGTPSYLAPEVVKGGAADARSDIFSLGAVIYELLTGRRAFPGDNLSTIIYRVIAEQPSPPSTVVSSLPAGLNHAVLKALAKEPEGRYTICADLVADLKNHRALEANGTAVAQSANAAAPFPELLARTSKFNAEDPALRTQPMNAAQVQPSPASRARFGWLAAAVVGILLVAGFLWRSRMASNTVFPPSDGSALAPAASAPSSPGDRPESPATSLPPKSPQPVSASPPDRAASAPPPSSIAVTLPGSGGTAASEAGPATAVAMGRVAIHTAPAGARITIDGQETSYRSPVNIVLPAAMHQIKVERAGFATESRDVVVEASRALQVRIVMKRAGLIRRLNPFRR